MERPFAVFDIDGTLIRWQLFHAITDTLAKQGQIDPQTYQFIREARMNWKHRKHSESFKTYEQQLVTVYLDLLRTLTVDQLVAAATSVFNEYKDQSYTYTRDLIKSLKRQGYLLFAISGSQQEVITPLANYYGFDDYVGSIYENDGHSFTGASIGVLGRKDEVLEELVNKHQASWQGSIGVGDSAGDIKMLELVEQPIAFNPEQSLLEHAKNQLWQLVIERKNVIYKLEARDGSYILV